VSHVETTVVFIDFSLSVKQSVTHLPVDYTVLLSLFTPYAHKITCNHLLAKPSVYTSIGRHAGVPWRQSHQHSGLATLPSVGAVP